MTFSRKQKVFIWITISLVALFIGFEQVDKEKNETTTLTIIDLRFEIYGIILVGQKTIITTGLPGVKPFSTEIQNGLIKMKGKVSFFLYRLGGYKYHLIVATLLIGLTGVLLSGKKTKKE